MLQRPLSAGQKLFALSALELSPRMTLDLKLLEQPTPNLYNCLLVLNNRFTASDLSLLVKQSEHVVLSDGGANRLYDSSERDCNKVKAIVGDLDSIRYEVLGYYASKHVQIVKSDDHDTTDFEKGVWFACKHALKTIVCLGALGGRMDHTLAALSDSQKIQAKDKDLHLLLYGYVSLMYCLHPKLHYIIKLGEKINKKEVGLVPFLESCGVETSGFKWEIGQKSGLKELKWGEMISTSNEIMGNEVYILSEKPIYFVGSYGY